MRRYFRGYSIFTITNFILRQIHYLFSRGDLVYIEVNEEGAFSFHDSLCACLDFDTSKGTLVIVIMGHFDKNSKHHKQDKKQHKKVKETRTKKKKQSNKQKQIYGKKQRQTAQLTMFMYSTRYSFMWSSSKCNLAFFSFLSLWTKQMNKKLLVIHIYLWKYGMLAQIWSFIRGTFMPKLKLGLCSSLITTGKVEDF